MKRLYLMPLNLIEPHAMNDERRQGIQRSIGRLIRKPYVPNRRNKISALIERLTPKFNTTAKP